ncbi:MAG TPA: helix-turn-helix domain-containing protein [Gemmataceae bacterium]|jgi:two-component system nitrogen regulation response regulator GlnG|nr:helix-turn-helix domain-containing protein [Gemmataceae bacterium]
MADASTTPVIDARSLDVGQLIAGLLSAQETDIFRKVNTAVERVVIEAVLRHVRGNQVAASQMLGISRTTLRNKMKSFGLTIERQVLPPI